VPGAQRKMTLLLKEYLERMDEVRGEHLHEFRGVGDDQFLCVHFASLPVLGRRKPQKSCHYQVSWYEALLRRAGLLNDWRVDEVECGAVTGSYDCVFTIRSSRARGTGLGPLVGLG
jgi:hypothetical protein